MRELLVRRTEALADEPCRGEPAKGAHLPGQMRLVGGAGIGRRRGQIAASLPDTRPQPVGVSTTAVAPVTDVPQRHRQRVATVCHACHNRCSGVVASGCSRSTGALAVFASGPAARPALPLLEFFLGPANASLSRRRLLRVFYPTDELVAGEGRDVIPRVECGPVPNERGAEVGGELVHHTTGHPRRTHRVTVPTP